MQYQQIYSFLMPKLEQELPASLAYHNSVHTASVISSAEHLAMMEELNKEDTISLKTAALFHDSGFLMQPENHEENSCKMARKYLPHYDYNDHQIDKICDMIMATKLPQNPGSKLAEILCDADLYYLGTQTYTERAAKLYQEIKLLGGKVTPNEWEHEQIAFLSNHHFFTLTARNECEHEKQASLKKLLTRQKNNLNKSAHSNQYFLDAFLIIVGVAIAALALKGFLVPNHFFDGGVTGISLLTHELYHFNLAIVIVLFNLPFIFISYYSVNKTFAFKTLASVVLLGLFLAFFPSFALTHDKLLISIFGGVFLGIGIGLVMRAGGALDGIEVFALYTLKRTSFTISEIILGINILIFSIAAFNFGIETALYSILTYFSATRTIDYVVEGLQACSGVTIVSARSEEIKYHLVERLGRGITVYKGERGYLPNRYDVHSDCDIIFTVITRLELRRLKNLVHQVDPHAFMYVSTLKEAAGGVMKQLHRH